MGAGHTAASGFGCKSGGDSETGSTSAGSPSLRILCGPAQKSYRIFKMPTRQTNKLADPIWYAQKQQLMGDRLGNVSHVTRQNSGASL
jgi:hypothetical protein